MSARKPLARMDSPAVTEAADEAPTPIDSKEEVTALKIESTENGGKPDITAQNEEEKDIKEEKTDTNDAEPTVTQIDPSGSLDAKRVTRNSPMLIASPLKKNSQEQDSLSESQSTMTVDEPPKKNEKTTVGRPRKQSDPSNKSSCMYVPPTNRLTRKAAEQQLAANTRLTRARRASAGIGSRPETPPKRKYAVKNKADPPAPAVKRKRSASPKLSEEPDVKVQKAEDQDADFEINNVIVKQEILESSEEMASDVASDITEPFPSRISLRARKSAACYSPTTRSYRREKDKEKKEESTALDGKRKRLNKVRPDEDSKDSLASSTMDDMVDIKVEEKFESEDANEAILPATPSSEISALASSADMEVNSTPSKPPAENTAESIDLPLTVDTAETITLPLSVDNTEIKSEILGPSTSAAASEQSNSSDKAASLSPELVSEGVSEISVKRFYKKPEFLKNNLGIEKDPKLGEIVQTVAEKMDDAVDGTSVSNDSIKEGELVFEEEDEEVASIGSIKNDNDDANSVSTGFISPLIVEEDEEEEDVDTQLVPQLQLPEKTDANEKVEDEKIKEIDTEETPSGNGSVEYKSEKVLVKENIESCLKAVLDDIEKKDADETDKDLEELLCHIKEEKTAKLIDDSVENPVAEKEETEDHKVEEITKADVEEIKVEECKVEETIIEDTITDQEENKENVGLTTKSMKEVTQEVLNSPEKDRDASMSTDEQESPSNSSKTSPSKTQGEFSGEGSTPSTSPQSSKSPSVPRTPENDEKLRQKERHLKTLGLLTHKAADEAIMAKQKRRKFLHNLSSNNGSKKNTNANAAASTGSAAGNAQNKSSQEYTGTLKTVIKLNRQSGGGASGGATEPKRGKNVETTGAKAAASGCGSRRHSLKMTFQKGRGRPANTEKSGDHPANTSGEDSYYTIQNEGEGPTPSTSATTAESTSTTTTTTTTITTHGRKSYNRSNTTDASHHAEHHEILTSKKDEKEEILIPEKASSFKFHPGRLCQDQCYYCSGKFGLYDTPCHVGQIKSVERQQKILANEEKLTVDNCLCDACFRHVDRRANVPSYKKRLSAPGHIETVKASTTADDASSEQEKTQQQKTAPQSHANGSAAAASHICAVPDCGQKAAHSLRRKGIRKSIKKSLLNFDMSTAGTYLHICEKHYEAVVQSSGCVLCKRRLGKSNMYHITTDTDRLERALADMGIPVALGQGTAVCKLCRYFANLLMKPPENGKVQKVQFVKNYRKRLLQFYNIHDKKDTSNEESEEEKSKEKPSSKKQTTPSTSKRTTRKSRTPEEDPKETVDMVPPSPAHSTGSSVEMISDGNIFNTDDDLQRSTTSSTAPTTPATNAASNQMVLDNDVMVDYDVPMISDSSSASSNSTSPSPQRMKESRDEQSKLKAILQSNGTSLEDRNDISTVLRSNPNISMRELFPGEEDLGLQFKAPFGSSSSQRTPEGWTRVNTFLQYDEPTRRLWEDLQKPYGNQSSFLRHLILLEKYYRNGDLVLSSSASSNATVYSRTVRNRLTSFDSQSSSSSSLSKELECRSRSLSVDKIQRQLSSNSVTITARPKEPKVQQKEEESTQQKDTSNSAGGSGGGAAAAKSTPNSRSILKTNLIGVKGGAIEIVPLSASNSLSNSPQSSSGSNTPNDSTSLTKQQKILAAANKLMNKQLETSPNPKKNALNTTPPELISLNRRPVATTPQAKRPQLLPKPMAGGKSVPIPPNVIVLPDTLTSQERLESKSWRPTLLPVTTTSHHLNNQQGPLYQTADGRRLPALVQVQSGGRPFLISIHDYNRMCILRREKLMRDQMLKGGKGKVKGAIFPAATCVSNNSNKTAISTEFPSFTKTMQAVTAAENAAKKQRLIMSKANFKIGNYTPIAPKPTQTSTTATTSPPSTCTSQQQQQTQPQTTMILPAGSLQPISLLSSTQPPTLSILPGFTGQVVPLLNTNTSTATATSVSGVPTSSWLWNNFPDSNQMLMNGKATATKGPQATVTSMKQQSLLLDNNLMSKIPKSLTVIPQHKLMPPAAMGSSSVVGNVSKD